MLLFSRLLVGRFFSKDNDNDAEGNRITDCSHWSFDAQKTFTVLPPETLDNWICSGFKDRQKKKKKKKSTLWGVIFFQVIPELYCTDLEFTLTAIHNSCLSPLLSVGNILITYWWSYSSKWNTVWKLQIQSFRLVSISNTNSWRVVYCNIEHLQGFSPISNVSQKKKFDWNTFHTINPFLLRVSSNGYWTTPLKNMFCDWLGISSEVTLDKLVWWNVHVNRNTWQRQNNGRHYLSFKCNHWR